MKIDLTTQSWCLINNLSLSGFVLSMLDRFGTPVETLLVGAFHNEGRGAQRDMELDMHQDGIRDPTLARRQGGSYVEHPDVDIVGFYCLREDKDCTTFVQEIGGDTIHSIKLKTGGALILDNRRVRHGRKGEVNDRVLFRIWMTR